MRKIIRFFKQSFKYSHHEKGQGLVEYALILGFVALGVLAIVGMTEISIEDTFSKIAGNAPVAPPSLLSYTPPPTYTPIPTQDPNATQTFTPTATDPANPPQETPTETHTATATSTSEVVCTGYAQYPIPGKVQMENFKCGGASAAFADSTGDGGPGSDSYRQDVSTEGPDLGATGGGHYLGWTTTSEWVKYDANVLSTKLHDIKFQVSSTNGNGKFHIEIKNNGAIIHTSSSVAVPNTGGTQNWQTISMPSVPFVQGTNEITFVIDSGGFNIDYFEATQSAALPTATHTPSPTATLIPTNTPTTVPTATPGNQGVKLVDAHFENGDDGFKYSDDEFYNTNQRDYATGYRKTESNPDPNGQKTYLDTYGALAVQLGGGGNWRVDNMSGAWREGFRVPQTGLINVTYRYRLLMDSEYENDECSESLVSIDGDLFGKNGQNYQLRDCGGIDSGWRTVSFDANLSKGNHTIRIGAYNNKKTWSDEITIIYIDDVVITTN